jgi:hypothetical protein
VRKKTNCLKHRYTFPKIKNRYVCVICRGKCDSLELLVKHIVKKHSDRESDLREFGINLNALIRHNHHSKLVNICKKERAER